VYNLPIISQLILLLHWILVTINDFLAGLGLGPNWSWGLAIIGLTIIVRLVLFPLTWKQYKSAQQMQVIQPQIKELQKKYKSDRAKLQEETMKLYSEHRVNPFASCLPLVLQLPVFISLYAAIKGVGPLSAPEYQESVKALAEASFLWIPHLGLPDPTYVLLVLYVATQMISTELMVATQSDSTQKWIMRAMPIMFVLFLFRFPAGLFVYWVTTNIWTIGQQLIIRRTMPKPEELAARAKAKPKKKSRFMEMMAASQQEAAKQREQKIAQKGEGGTAKQGSVAAGKKPAPGAKKAPPGKGKRKPGQTQGGKPGQAGARPKSQGGQTQQKPGGQQGKPRPAADKPAADKPSGDKPSGGSPASGGDQGSNTSAGGPADE
jgi:YidC/Oxa1 family membrane protein insertase